MYEKFEYLIGKETPDNIEITEELLTKAVDRCIKDRRRRKDVKEQNPTDFWIVDNLVEENDIYNSIKSMVNISKRNEERNSVDNNNNIENETINSNDNDFWINNLYGYTSSEKKIIKERYEAYKKFYFDNKIAPNDEFDLIEIIEMEFEIDKIKKDIKSEKSLDPMKDRKALSLLRDQRNESLKGLNAMKAQRENPKNKIEEQGSLSKIVNSMDKPIEEMEKEAQELKEKKNKFMKERKKRKN